MNLVVCVVVDLVVIADGLLRIDLVCLVCNSVVCVYLFSNLWFDYYLCVGCVWFIIGFGLLCICNVCECLQFI